MTVNSLSGPSIPDDEIHRTCRKIENEQKQLPKGAANLLIIHNNLLFFRYRIEEILHRVEEEVFKHPHILMAAVVGRLMAPCEPKLILFGNHQYSERSEADLLLTQTLVLHNRFCDYKVSPNMVLKVQAALRGV